MIRKFVTTNTQSSVGGTSDTAQRPMASPTSQIDSNHEEEGKKLYAQSLESTENSVINGQTNGQLCMVDPLLYPIGSDEHDTSTDEGLSMSEEEDQITPHNAELTRLMNDLDIDHKLKSAAQKGNTELVKELLFNGAQVITDENGSTAIHVAAQNGFAEVVRLLVENGTDVDFPDEGGYTALHKAAASGHLDVLELLINEGCDIDTQDDTYGNTPLHEAAWHGFSKSVDLLLKNKSNAFITNRAGCTPLHLAAQNGHNQSGRTLLYGGCSPDVKNNYGDTPLHTSARYGHAGIARILISAKCSIAEQNKNGDTALHITSAFKRRKIAKLLVEAGAPAAIRNKQDETPVDIARRKDNLEIIEIINQTSLVTQSIHESNRHVNRKPNKMEVVQEGAKVQFDSKTEKVSKTKSHNAFISWIRKKILKKPSHQPTKSRATHTGKRVENFDADIPCSNQYVRKPGFAYYRDLAGNIRQGPCGFVPACHCEPDTVGKSGAPSTNRRERNYADIKESQLVLSDKMAELKMAAERHKTNERTSTEVRSGLRTEASSREPQEYPGRRLQRDQVDINRQLAQVENDLQELRGDLKTWLTTQVEEEADFDTEENPFAYTSGAMQTRFGDDFDHERMARYDATEQFPPPPRLFRCRSDETLSHSEYSYHGRAFKSKEAAMEELKTLKHHEELRAERRRIRARGDDYQYDRLELRSSEQLSKSNTYIKDNSRVSAKGNLWQSQENLRHKKEMAPKQEIVESGRRIDKSDAEHMRPVPKTRQMNASLHGHTYQPNSYQSRMYSDHQTSVGRAPVHGTTEQPANQSHVSHVANRPIPTYRLISAALNNPNTSISQHAQSNAPPVPAQRSHSMTIPKTNATVTNPPFSRYQSQAGNQNRPLYAEVPSHQNVRHQPNVDHRRHVDNSSSQIASAPVRNSTDAQSHDNLNNTPRRHLPSYEEAKGQRQQSSQSARDQKTNVPTGAQQILNRSTAVTASNSSKQQSLEQRQSTGVVEPHADNLVVQTGESCCGSSNPDSGYGGQAYDFYASQPSPQQKAAAKQTVEEYDTSWYNRKLQDASRRMNTGHLRPHRTMTSDV